MSRTRRSCQYAKYYRKPKTANQRRNWLKAEEEIKDELGPNYLAGNFAQLRQIPTSWEDMPVEGRFENYNHAYKTEDQLENLINGDRRKIIIDVDERKGVIRVGRSWSARHTKFNPKSYYLPFVYNYRRRQLPLIINMHMWS